MGRSESLSDGRQPRNPYNPTYQGVMHSLSAMCYHKFATGANFMFRSIMLLYRTVCLRSVALHCVWPAHNYRYPHTSPFKSQQRDRIAAYCHKPCVCPVHLFQYLILPLLNLSTPFLGMWLRIVSVCRLIRPFLLRRCKIYERNLILGTPPLLLVACVLIPSCSVSGRER